MEILTFLMVNPRYIASVYNSGKSPAQIYTGKCMVTRCAARRDSADNSRFSHEVIYTILVIL